MWKGGEPHEQKRKGSQISDNKQREKWKPLVIHLLNIQGLTRAKQIEIMDLIKEEGAIICLTETQQKIEKITWTDCIEKVEKMRNVQDKKGGGLLMAFKKNNWLKMEQVETTNADVLYVVVKAYSTMLNVILLYFSIPKAAKDKDRNQEMRKEVETIIGKAEERGEACLVLGDFNGHIDMLGYQKQDENGLIVLDWMNECNMNLLNLDVACQGTYTWTRDNQKSVIDFVLANNKCYEYFQSLYVDEERELLDISDHNLLTVTLKIQTGSVNFRKGKVTRKPYLKTDEDSLEKFSVELEKRLVMREVENMEDLNGLMKEVAEKTLKGVYQRRVNEKYSIKEPPWITKEIREEIKKRKDINRKKRNARNQTATEKDMLCQEYKHQKRKVQMMVKEAITVSERKITEEIRKSKNKSKSLWENIDKLKKNERVRAETHLHDTSGNLLELEEEREQLTKYWTSIYQKHENEAKNKWYEEHQKDYKRAIEQENKIEQGYAKILREHVDMAFHIDNVIDAMEEPVIAVEEVKALVAGLKLRTAPGPDGLKNELYRELAKSTKGLQVLTRCMRTEIGLFHKPESWKSSITIMIPKKRKPTARHLRPIALTDASYKLYMSMIKNKIEQHLRENNEIMEIQAGFTRSGRVEDNLFLLNYCVEESYCKKKPLYVTAIDYSKAFDSVKRSKLVDAMMKYKIHPSIISSVVSIYSDDYTRIKLNGEIEENINVTSGIRQGCTGSTTLFKLITYLIAKELMTTRMGYNDKHVYLPLLLFADDGLLLSQSKGETERMIRVLSKESEKCGLQVNKEKSVIMIYNQDEGEDSTEIEGIPVVEETKYLGVKIVNKKDIFKEQRKIAIKTAQKMSAMTYGIISKSCNKLMIGKAYWKNLALPSIMYGTNITTLSEAEIKKLQTIENGVYRRILGAPRYAPNCTLRGEIGSSLMKTRVMKSHVQYMRSALQGSNELLKKVMKLQMEKQKSKWSKETSKYLQLLGLKIYDLETKGKGEIAKSVEKWDVVQWKEEVNAKTSLQVYKVGKENVQEDPVYDNTPASVILYQARSNSIPLEDKKRFSNEVTLCRLCKKEVEDLAHFILECNKLNEVRTVIPSLQRPYKEDKNQVMRDFLFSTENEARDMEEKKLSLYELWRARKKMLSKY